MLFVVASTSYLLYRKKYILLYRSICFLHWTYNPNQIKADTLKEYMQFSPRSYQQEIFETTKLHNTLVVIPTGLGKTAIAMLLAEHRIKQYPKSKTLILAPTKPLVEQHYTSFAEQLPDVQSLGVVLTGRVKPEKRAEQFAQATFIFSTPQTIENDLLAGRIDLKEVSLLVLDEAHRATGEYAYVQITKEYAKQARNERILALTASPGSKKAVIQEIVDNCRVEKIEVRSKEDPEVEKYIQETKTTFIEVALPEELQQLQKDLKRVIELKKKHVESLGIIQNIGSTKGELLRAQGKLQGLIKEGNPEPEVWSSISVLAEALKAEHALELLETQSLQALLKYLQSLKKQAQKGASKAVKNLMTDPEFRHVVREAIKLKKRGLEHPKLLRAASIAKVELAKNPQAKIIIFNQYRDAASTLAKMLKDKAQLFVGQQKKGSTGLSQKEQQAMLDAFREGEFPILVATAVGEEGLDIPSVDLVLFYEPVASAIRTIQRRGRTGRHDTGRVQVLLAKDTRDVAYRWSAHHKEKRMYRNLKQLAGSIKPTLDTQKGLDEYAQEDQVLIYADSREKSSGVLKALRELPGVKLRLKSLSVGDYVLSKRVCVEFKYADDFVDSLLDGRLFSQLRELTHYQRPVMIVQGSDWYAKRNVHPNAVRGALSAVAVSFGVPILVSQNDKDTAQLLQTIAERENKGAVGGAEFVSSTSSSTNQQLVELVASIPAVGPVLAPRILKHFRTLRAVIAASPEDLQAVEGVGKKKAQEICAFLDERFTG